MRARLLALLFALAGSHLAAAAPLSVGIAAPPDCAEVADLLLSELATNPQLQLLDRSAFPDLRHERVLPGSGMGASEPLPQSLLQADVILRLRKERDRLHVQAASVRSGIVLQAQSYPWPGDESRQLVTARLIAADCQHAWSKAHTPHEQLRLVSLPRIVSINGAKGDASFVNALNYLLRERLQRNARLVVVERLNLADLAIEREGRKLPQLAQSAHVFGGAIDEFAQGPEGPVRISMRDQSAAQEKQWQHKRDTSIEALTEQIASWIESSTGASGGATAAAKRAEPQQILQRAQWSSDILLHEQTLELVSVFHHLAPPTAQSRELQFAAGIEYFSPLALLRKGDADKIVATAVDYAAFLHRELAELARSTRPYDFKNRVPSAFHRLGRIARWQGASQPPNDQQEEALRSLRAQLDRLAEAVQTLELPNESQERIARAAYTYRLSTSTSWSDFAAVYREAAAKGLFIDRREAMFEIRRGEWTQLLESIYRAAPGPEEQFTVGVIWCRDEENATRRATLYQQLAELIWAQRDTFLADPRFALFKQIRQLETLRLKRRDLPNVEVPLVRTMAYVLENATTPIVRFDANNYKAHLKSPEAAAMLREAAQKSEQRFTAHGDRGAAHAETMRALLKEIAGAHPEQSADAPAAADAQPVRSTWFWNLYAAIPREEGRRYIDSVRGLYVYQSELWCTNGYVICCIGLDGRGKEIVSLPDGTWRRRGGLTPDGLGSLAVSARFIVAGAGAPGRYTYHVQNRESGTWRQVPSPFGSGQAAGSQAFSELVFAGGKLLRPAQIRTSSAANVYAVEMLDPETGELSYPVRGDRTPPEGPMDVPGNRFEIAGTDATGAIWLTAQRHGGKEKATSQAWHPGTGKWRPLSAAETQFAKELTLPLSAVMGKAAGGELTRPFQDVRLQSRMSEASPLRLQVGPLGNWTTVPLQLSIPEEELAMLRTLSAHGDRGSRDVIGEMLTGRQVRGRWIPEGLIAAAYPELGVFFFERQSIAAWIAANKQPDSNDTPAGEDAVTR